QRDNGFEKLAAEQAEGGFFSDYWVFLRHNKKWWLLPLLAVLLLFGALLWLSGTAAAPFSFTLFLPVHPRGRGVRADGGASAEPTPRAVQRRVRADMSPPARRRFLVPSRLWVVVCAGALVPLLVHKLTTLDLRYGLAVFGGLAALAVLAAFVR